MEVRMSLLDFTISELIKEGFEILSIKNDGEEIEARRNMMNYDFRVMSDVLYTHLFDKEVVTTLIDANKYKINIAFVPIKDNSRKMNGLVNIVEK